MQLRGFLRSITTLVVAFASSSAIGAASPVDYLREVKPILRAQCHQCHGASQQKGALRVDTARSLQRGGDHGASFTPGQSTSSLLLQVLRGSHDTLARMPYKKPALSDSEIALIAQWIDQGATAPADEPAEQNVHWSFKRPVRPDPPPVRHLRWPRNPIDKFILARLEQEGLRPSPEADRITLLRRVSLDLTGLPPSPDELQAYLGDRSPDAYEKVVERLLASPHFGERWGRHWLDVARYADSNGYSIDAPRSIWKYRDWVINALNRDLPFDRFVIEQLAGDLLPNASIDQKIATGFHRNTQINQEGGIDPEQFRVESVMDRVNTTATAFLGITFACAQCHDHKFDPFTQREYYQLYAFFNNSIEDGHGKSAPEGMLEVPGESEAEETIQREITEVEEDLERYLRTVGNEVVTWEIALPPEERSKLKPAVREALQKRFDQRTPAEKRIVYAAFRPEDPDFKQRKSRLDRLERRQGKPVTTLVMVEGKKPRESTVFIKGDFTRRGAPVQPGVPAILHPLKQNIAGETESRSAPDRLDLARWIADPENPLTARVLANRVWQQYFGRGLVETENDFGTQGTPPSHPDLLDWLACELMEPGRVGDARLSPGASPAPWSVKHLHRLIVTSAAYRQSSKARPDLAIVDPANKLLARQARLRLDAEIVRDVALTASGLLSRTVGGPSVFPPQPDGVMNLGQSRREWKPSPGPDRYRRGLYTFFWRATPHPSLMVFDGADGFSACTRRVRSNTPLQALTVLNDEAFHECAQALALRLFREPLTSDAARIKFAFRLCVSRSASPSEVARLLDLFQHELTAFTQTPDDAMAVAGPKSPVDMSIPHLAAWTTIARVLLNLDETITRE